MGFMRIHRRRRVVKLLILGLGLAAASSPGLVRAEGWRLTVRQARARRGETPVIIKAPGAMASGNYMLTLAGGIGPIKAQVYSDAGKQWLGIVLPPADIEGTYELEPTSPSNNGQDNGVLLAARGPNLRILIDQKPFSEYRID